MPRFNGLGPEGKGSMTGRGLGRCNKDNIVNNQDATNLDNENNLRPNYYGRPMGGAFRGGRGRGRGFACNGRRIRGNF